MDITFLLIRWLIILTGYFLLGLTIGSIVAFLWMTWKEKRATKEFMKYVTSKRK